MLHKPAVIFVCFKFQLCSSLSLQNFLKKKNYTISPKKSRVGNKRGASLEFQEEAIATNCAVLEFSFRTNKEEYLLSLSRDNLQYLVNKLYELPTERVDEVIVAKIPEPILR